VIARHGIEMPPLRSMLGRIGFQVVEATLIPAALFWSVLHLSGLVWALLAALAWCYLCIARRWVRGGAMPAVLLVAALLFTTRTGIALAFHSTFVYLLTPTINAFVLAVAFLGSAIVGRPLTARFARDFVGLPAHVTALARVHRALRLLCGVWALTNVVNGWVSLQLLIANRFDAVMLARSIMTPTFTTAAVTCCVLLGRRALRQEGIHLHLRWRDHAEPIEQLA